MTETNRLWSPCELFQWLTNYGHESMWWLTYSMSHHVQRLIDYGHQDDLINNYISQQTAQISVCIRMQLLINYLSQRLGSYLILFLCCPTTKLNFSYTKVNFMLPYGIELLLSESVIRYTIKREYPSISIPCHENTPDF